MARIRALEEMYPLRTRTEIIGDLLSAALDEVEAGFPQYKDAQLNVLDPSTNEPLYEVRGPAFEFRGKANKHYLELEKMLGNQNPSPLFSSETYVDIESAFED